MERRRRPGTSDEEARTRTPRCHYRTDHGKYGCIPPRDGYLERLRDVTRQWGALLILDEVVTGFRYAPGGCQEYYRIQPDISTFGKALGAGFPVGAVAGPRLLLSRMQWGSGMVLHSG